MTRKHDLIIYLDFVCDPKLRFKKGDLIELASDESIKRFVHIEVVHFGKSGFFARDEQQDTVFWIDTITSRTPTYEFYGSRFLYRIDTKWLSKRHLIYRGTIESDGLYKVVLTGN